MAHWLMTPYDPRISENISVSEISDFNNQFDILFNQLNLLGMKVLVL